MQDPVGIRIAFEEEEAKMWRAMVNAKCPNSVKILRPFQKDLYDNLVIMAQLGVATSHSSPERMLLLAKCAQKAHNTPIPLSDKPYLVLVSLEKVLVPVRMDREDMCDYDLFTARIQERVPMYDKVLDHGWQHWETCREQRNFFLSS
jgi:hypothetical protein